MKIAILGHGTVGRGVDEIIADCIPSLEVARILELPDRCTDERMTSDFDDIAQDPSIEAVVECMGGIEPAHTYIVAALRAGKHVITSNKAVVAEYLTEFAHEAAAAGVGLFVEATCGGGIPWIASIEKVRRIDEVSSFSGILNGTTNYIIDEMARKGLDFDVVLARAQELGYAEADPSADIDGIDVRNKTIITAAVAFGVACTTEFPVTGMRTLTKADMDMLHAHGMSVKVLGRGVCKDQRYAVAVEPVALPERSLEACVPANNNIASVTGATIGELKFYGQGAGSLPTGNAMVQDLFDCQNGVRPTYDMSAELSYDPTLLVSDYLLRTTAEVPAEAEAFDEGVWRIHKLTATEARELFERICKDDPTSFMAAIAEGAED